MPALTAAALIALRIDVSAYGFSGVWPGNSSDPVGRYLIQ
jgi:hypothetical protein